MRRLASQQLVIRLVVSLSILLGILPLAWGTHVLIMISPEAAGPSVIASTYVHDCWVLWPPVTESSGTNRLISISLSYDPMVASDTFKFRESGDGGYRVLGNTRIDQLRGYQESLPRATIYVPAAEGVDRRLLAMVGVREDRIVVIRDPALIKNQKLVITRAQNWDEVSKIRKGALEGSTGKIIVFEYPPSLGTNYSRFWVYGKSWPPGIPSSGAIPGLVDARNLSQAFDWPVKQFANIRPLSFGGANRWLEVSLFNSRIRTIFVVVLSIPIFLAAFLLGREISPNGREIVATVSLVSFSAILFSTLVWRAFGIGGWPMSLFLTALILSLAAVLWTQFSRRQAPLASLFTMLLLGVAFVDGHWSPLSPVLSGSSGAFGEQLAMIVIFGAFAVSWTRQLDGLPWVAPRLILLGLVIHGLLGSPSWTGGHSEIALLPLAAWLVGDGLSPWPIGAMILLNPMTFVRLMEFGFVWAPQGLFSSPSDVEGINLYTLIRSLLQPESVMIFSLLASVAMFSPTFMRHQLRRITKDNDALKSGLSICCIILVASFLQPALAAAIPWSFGLLAVVLSYEAMHSPKLAPNLD